MKPQVLSCELSPISPADVLCILAYLQMRALLRTRYEMGGLLVAAVADASHATRVLQTQPPDLVVLDSAEEGPGDSLLLLEVCASVFCFFDANRTNRIRAGDELTPNPLV